MAGLLGAGRTWRALGGWDQVRMRLDRFGLVLRDQTFQSKGAKAVPGTSTNGNAGAPVFQQWYNLNFVTPAGVISVPGGTGSSRSKRKEFRRKVVKSEQIFREEMAKLEQDLRQAVADRVALEQKIDEIPLGEPVPLSVQKYIIKRDRAAEHAHLKERLEAGIPVYVKVRREKAAALKRMQRLLHIAQHQEFVAREKLRQITEQIDEEAAGAFMRWLMAEWEWE